LPERHGLGYGTEVVQAALDAAAELGERLVVVLGNPSYYRRFGFRPAAELGLASPWSGLGAPWQALVLPDDTSGAPSPPRGEVRYPAAWAAV
jgi:putative acetyltransferase